MNKNHLIVYKSSLSNSILNTLSALSLQEQRHRAKRESNDIVQEIHKGKMPSVIDVIVALLHRVTGPRHCRHSRGGGWHHRRPASALTATALAPSNPRVLERP
jgi:hypothetical protein